MRAPLALAMLSVLAAPEPARQGPPPSAPSGAAQDLPTAAGQPDPFAAGLGAYREGRFEDALEAFTRAEQEAGHGAPVELVYDRALAALRAGRLRVAELSAEKAAARGGPRFTGLRDFLLGSAAFARCELLEAQASQPEADPTAFDAAIARAATAVAFWRRAAASRADWPEARRNVERALLKLDALRREKAAADASRRAKKERQPQAQPPPERDPSRPGERTEVEPGPQQEAGELSPDQLERLLGVLAEKEREKRALRVARQRARGAAVEKDW